MASEKKAKQTELPTVKKYKNYRNLRYGLKAATYAECLTPFGIELAVHWQEWFSKGDDSGVSIGLGFGMLLVSTLATMVAVMKRDEDFMKKYSPLFYVAILGACWAASFIFLGNIMQEMGMMLLYTSFGVAAGAITDEVNNSVVKPKMEKFSKLVADYGLTDKAESELADVAQAQKDKREREKRKKEPTE